MLRALKITLFAAMILVLSVGSYGAEPLKLRPMVLIYVDGKGSGIKQPEGISCRGDALVVADTGNGRLIKYTIAGEKWTPGGEFVLPQVPSPIRLDVSSKGEIFALDGKSRRIARIASSGEFLGYVAPTGDLKGTVVPRSLRVDRDDKLYILDVFTARVLVMDPSGKVFREIPFPKEYGFFSDLAVDQDGNILLLDSVGKRVFKAAKSSQEVVALSDSLKDEVYFPTSITTDKQGRIFLVDQNGSGIVILGSDGSFQGRQLSMGWREGFLRNPAQMCIMENGTAFIADRGNSRIDGFLVTE